jgi:hypothetical protein
MHAVVVTDYEIAWMIFATIVFNMSWVQNAAEWWLASKRQ